MCNDPFGVTFPRLIFLLAVDAGFVAGNLGDWSIASDINGFSCWSVIWNIFSEISFMCRLTLCVCSSLYNCLLLTNHGAFATVRRILFCTI